jgi:N-glycosylase/DNA lyase
MNLDEIYNKKKSAIEKRLGEFKQMMNANDNDIFAELCFCLLTPQSKAKTCWRAIESLKKNGLLYNGNVNEIKKHLTGVRFHNNKANYIMNARKMFTENGKIVIKEKLFGMKNVFEMRDFLVKNVKGLGMKEASHFLRNIGLFDDIAILDRHILKNLKKYSVIKEIPKSLTVKKYLEIEEKMIKFCDNKCIPMPYLDLIFWSEEAGEIFK